MGGTESEDSQDSIVKLLGKKVRHDALSPQPSRHREEDDGNYFEGFVKGPGTDCVIIEDSQNERSMSRRDDR